MGGVRVGVLIGVFLELLREVRDTARRMCRLGGGAILSVGAETASQHSVCPIEFKSRIPKYNKALL